MSKVINNAPINVMIAGIAGASLGTELMKALRLHADEYRLYGCDISPLAYGHSQTDFTETFVVDDSDYVTNVLKRCQDLEIDILVPGGEQPLVLLGGCAENFQRHGVRFAANTPSTMALCCDKYALPRQLATLGFDVPLTLSGQNPENFAKMPYPCIVKPANDSGGSAYVYLTETRAEAEFCAHYIQNNGRRPILQEYLPLENGGEFTVGVLSLSDGSVYGSVAMRRCFNSKLSISVSTRSGLISSGNSQGLIAPFPEVCAVAEKIAEAVGSCGPLNVQGRLRGGTLVPFEINPRFSCSTYLRAMAGFEEAHVFLRNLRGAELPSFPDLRWGYYLRSFSETYMPDDGTFTSAGDSHAIY